MSHNDWNNTASWQGYQVPANPDTIIVKHYITFSQNLTIAAPTVLIVEQNGTLCGDYLLDFACGASLFNFGHIYVNTAKIRDGKNYSEFYAKNQITILGCSLPGSGNGYYNTAPGQTLVWPPVLCKTPGTNWENGGFTAIQDYFREQNLVISPTISNSDDITVSCDQEIEICLIDLSGKLLYSGGGLRYYTLDMRRYAQGLYFVQVRANGIQTSQKLIKQ